MKVQYAINLIRNDRIVKTLAKYAELPCLPPIGAIFDLQNKPDKHIFRVHGVVYLEKQNIFVIEFRINMDDSDKAHLNDDDYANTIIQKMDFKSY